MRLLVYGSVRLDGECQLIAVSSVSFCVEVKLGRRALATALTLPWPMPREGCGYLVQFHLCAVVRFIRSFDSSKSNKAYYLL